MAKAKGDVMSVFLSILAAQLLDPLRIVLAIGAAWWALRQAPAGKRLLPLSVATFGLTALMSFVISQMETTPSDPNILLISFAAGLFSSAILIGLAAFIISKIRKHSG